MPDCEPLYDEVIDLITNWKRFKSVFPFGSMKDFGVQLAEEGGGVSWGEDSKSYIQNKSQSMAEGAAASTMTNRALAGSLIGRLTLFVRNYTKAPFQKIGLGSMDEFKILSLIDRLQNPNKSMLSQSSLMEFTTINDMLKRMEKRGWIEQTKDEKDKRSSRVALTEKGKAFVTEVYGVMANIKPGLLGDLSPEEQAQLLALLTRLNNFHTAYLQRGK